jgi:hypothetical protein
MEDGVDRFVRLYGQGKPIAREALKLALPGISVDWP